METRQMRRRGVMCASAWWIQARAVEQPVRPVRSRTAVNFVMRRRKQGVRRLTVQSNIPQLVHRGRRKAGDLEADSEKFLLSSMRDRTCIYTYTIAMRLNIHCSFFLSLSLSVSVCLCLSLWQFRTRLQSIEVEVDRDSMMRRTRVPITTIRMCVNGAHTIYSHTYVYEYVRSGKLRAHASLYSGGIIPNGSAFNVPCSLVLRKSATGGYAAVLVASV